MERAGFDQVTGSLRAGLKDFEPRLAFELLPWPFDVSFLNFISTRLPLLQSLNIASGDTESHTVFTLC